jgi:hypothetical protein
MQASLMPGYQNGTAFVFVREIEGVLIVEIATGQRAVVSR